MELDEIKQVSKELEDILEEFPDVPKGPVLQETKKTDLDKLQGAEDVETPCEDEATATLDSEIEDQELEAEDRNSDRKTRTSNRKIRIWSRSPTGISRRAAARRQFCSGERMNAGRRENRSGRTSPMES